MKSSSRTKQIVAGLISGVVLGLFLKAVQEFTDEKVYVLLLNVDYVPMLNRITFPEALEFGIHLLISILVSMILGARPRSKAFFILAGMVIGIVLYPTTLLSNRTPGLLDFQAIFYWLVGHALYGYVLSIFYTKIKLPR
ncbi:hypothetical protein AM500_20015 [Bacillus sp. FJAT-18017]|nr:hypothetical protein AM500_20015 [Bacillus sp. FJAT-18017]